jgi:hypothetical protein
LKALGDGKVSLLDDNSSIGSCGVQSHEEQIDNLTYRRSRNSA